MHVKFCEEEGLCYSFHGKQKKKIVFWFILAASLFSLLVYANKICDTWFRTSIHTEPTEFDCAV